MDLQRRVYLELDVDRDDWLRIEGIFHFAMSIAEAVYPTTTDLKSPTFKAIGADFPAVCAQCNLMAALDGAVGQVWNTDEDTCRVYIARTSVAGILMAGDALLSDKDLFVKMGTEIHRAFMREHKDDPTKGHEDAQAFLDSAMLDYPTWNKFRGQITNPDLPTVTHREMMTRLAELAIGDISCVTDLMAKFMKERRETDVV